MKLAKVQIDAFSKNVFSGNPAAVIPLDSWLSDELMLKIAIENNLSETAYLIEEGDQYHIRWFTPAAEVDLCGHATLASAHYLFEERKLDRSEVTFQSRSGPLKVKKLFSGYEMDFPIDSLEPVELDKEIVEALNLPIVQVFKGRDDILIITESEEVVKMANPDFYRLKKVGCRGFIITAKGTKTDIISRCFYPNHGIDEDPVTGSAHTTLAAYWGQHFQNQEFSAYQASSRGGFINCKIIDDRVMLRGQAVTYSVGEITI